MQVNGFHYPVTSLIIMIFIYRPQSRGHNYQDSHGSQQRRCLETHLRLAVDIKHYWVNSFPLLPYFSESLFCELGPSERCGWPPAPRQGRLTSYSEAQSSAALLCSADPGRNVTGLCGGRLCQSRAEQSRSHIDNTGILLEKRGGQGRAGYNISTGL